MKKILLLSSRHDSKFAPKFEAFHKKIGNLLDSDKIKVYSSTLDQLLFDVNGNDTKITDLVSGLEIAEFDLIVQRVVTGLAEEANALAIYCRAKNVKYIDSYLDRILADKLSSSFLYWSAGLKIPRTVSGSPEIMEKMLAVLGGKAILKDIRGAKGKNNYLVTDPEQIIKICHDNPEIKFILQEFIPNNSDYRILVLNYKPVLIINRTASVNSHLNNTSQGGKAELIDINSVSKELLEMSVVASKVEKLEVSGVDIMLSNNTNEPYILEVNQAPQIQSGSFVDEKTNKYVEMLIELLGEGK